MKRIIFILIAVLINTIVFANASFDKTVNYQFNNAKAYEGETLYLMPLTGTGRSLIGGGDLEHYHFFMNYNFNDFETSENSLTYHYKFNEYDVRDRVFAGTHKRHIEGHRFYVNKVKPYHPQEDYHYTWVFYLTDLNTGEKLKYIYHGDGKNTGIDFEVFPFMVQKHVNYCKSLIGTNLVFSTKIVDAPMKCIDSYYKSELIKNDYKTGKPIQYNSDYVKWKIINVIIDTANECICFIVTNGKHTVKVPYNIQYNPNHPKYNVGNRVFPEKQWNFLVNKYGEKHMALIMNTKISDDMTVVEKKMSGGKENKNETIENLKMLKNITIKSVKSTINDFKSLGKFFIN